MKKIQKTETPVPQLDLDTRREIADLFRILGDPTRLGIVYACLTTPMAAGDIAESLDISPSLASHHLRLLRAARLVRAERQGKNIYYVAADDHVSRVLSDMADHAFETVDEDQL
ncbi:MAG: metalloregulator ArsR/SmtB family transcription factor [Rhodospirillales bacterium]